MKDMEIMNFKNDMFANKSDIDEIYKKLYEFADKNLIKEIHEKLATLITAEDFHVLRYEFTVFRKEHGEFLSKDEFEKRLKALMKFINFELELQVSRNYMKRLMKD